MREICSISSKLQITDNNTFLAGYLLINNIATETIEHMGGSPGEVSEEPVMYEKRKNGWRMICDVDEATEGFENELRRR